MMLSSIARRTAGLVFAAWLTLMGFAAADSPSATDFKADDVVQTVTVKIEVGAPGPDLDEPVALDLGLGFPLWLHPLGRTPSAATPFGALPQQTDAGEKLAAGAGASFTFAVTGESGQDALLATPQLLAGVRVADIARVGLSSPGKADWILAAYQIEVNGKPFASKKEIGAKSKQALDAARTALAEVDKKLAPLALERADLLDLVQAKLAQDADLTRLAVIETSLKDLAGQRAKLDGQVRGTRPWFEDADFRSPWRQKPSVQSAKVVLTTSNHQAADSKNYVYLRTGGRKYLLGSPTAPLSPATGPQQFALDLDAGPLAAADIRGWAVGMLGTTTPFSKAPDRWHPERIVVQIDGLITYDSDENPLDRNSLAAIRLIPPAHFDDQGKRVVNTPVAREAFVWESGKGQGLDSATGQTQDLPAKDSPDFPAAEPGGAQPPPDQDAPADQGAPADQDAPPADSTQPETWQEPESPPFPGEDAPLTDGGGNLDGGFTDEGSPDADFPDGGDWGGGGWGGGGWGGGGWGGGGWGGGGGILDFLAWLASLLQQGVIPNPVGDPFQLKAAAFTAGWKADDNFTIHWETTGNEGEIDHYEVSLIAVYPDKAIPYGMALMQAQVPAGTHQYSGTLQIAKPVDVHFIAPLVVGIPSNPNNLSLHQTIGAARAVFPAGLALNSPYLALNDNFYFVSGMPPLLHIAPVSWGGMPAGTNSAVWPIAQPVEGHYSILFDPAMPAMFAGARLKPADLHLNVLAKTFSIHDNKKYRLVACLGFLGGAQASGDLDVTMRCTLTPVTLPQPPGAAAHTYQFHKTITCPPGGPPTPMMMFDEVIDPPAVTNGTPIFEGRVRFGIKNGAMNAQHPPAVLGARIVPEP